MSTKPSVFDVDVSEMEKKLEMLTSNQCDIDCTSSESTESSDKKQMNIEEIFTRVEPVINHALRNEWSTVIKILKQDKNCYIHLWLFTLLKGGIAGMSMDKSQFKSSLRSAWKGLEESKKYRKKDTGYFFNSKGDSYTDEECMAELIYSEYNAIYGVINAIDDQSIMGFVKGAYRIRICYNGLKHCEKILNEKTNWKNKFIQKEFTCGVLLGLGLFEMGISFVPRKFMLLLELAGYTSNRSFGLQQIEKASAIEESKFHKLAAIAANVLYNLFLENFYGLGEVKRDLLLNNLQFGRNLVDSTDYVPLADGLIQFVQGDFYGARENFSITINSEDNPRAFRYAVSWLQSWVAVIQSDWPCALHHANILTEECKWSRALFSYMRGIFIYMLLNSEPDHPQSSSLKEKMMQSFENVPKLKRNFGGKKAFHEKLVIERSRQFVENPTSIVMPHLDLMYLWNLMSIAKSNPSNLKRISQDISDTYVKLKENDSLDVDTKHYLIFMQGVTHSLLGEDTAACEAFMKVIQSSNDLNREVHLVPQACLELGFMYRKRKDHDQAVLWLRKAKKYSGYLTESMIKFRADCALKSIADSD